MEGHVYAFEQDTIIKIWRNERISEEYIQERKAFYASNAAQLKLIEYLMNKAKKIYGDELDKLPIYLAYYSLLFVNSKSDDPQTYMWCLKNLQELGYL